MIGDIGRDVRNHKKSSYTEVSLRKIDGNFYKDQENALYGYHNRGQLWLVDNMLLSLFFFAYGIRTDRKAIQVGEGEVWWSNNEIMRSRIS